jgi:GAF domain-containing protein
VLLYVVSVVSLFTLGLNGAGRIYLIAFAVLTTAVFGGRAGIAAAVLAILTWVAAAALFSLGQLAPTSPNDSALVVNWIASGASMLLVMVALMIPQRQFLALRLLAVGQSQANAALSAAQASLAAQSAAAEQAREAARTSEQQQAAQARVLERRATLLALNAEVASAAAGMRDVNDLLPAVANLIGERFGFYHAGIFLVDDAQEWAVLRAASSPGGQQMLARGHRLRIGREGIVGYVTNTGQARVARDVGVDAVHFINPDLPDTHSEIAVPLRAGGVILGALDVQSTEAGAFSGEDVAVLQSLANQIGLAIENARLFQESQQRVAELQLLQRESRAGAALRGTQEAVAYRYDGVEVTPLSDPPVKQAGTGPLGDLISIPLNLGDQRMGTLELHRAGAAWTADDLELSNTISDRLTLALESAELFEQTRVRAQQLASLSEVSLELTGPQLGTQQALDQIVAGALRLFDVDGAAIWLPAGGGLSLAVSSGAGETPSIGRQIALGQDLAGAAFAGQAMRLDDYERWSGRLAASPFHAVMALPMRWQSQALGVLVLGHSQPGRLFSGDEERIAQLYASQAASTLENARLFAETQQRLTELGGINAISQALASQSELGPLMQLVGDQVFSIFGVQNGYVALYDHATNLIEFPYFLEAGVPQTVAPRPLGQGLTSVVIQSRQPLLINQDASQQAAKLGAFIQGSPAKSWLGVPIPSGDDVIGAISVQDIDQEGRFDDADVRLLSTIAANIGVAIRNTLLFQETQRRADELATLNDISRDISTRLDVAALSELVVEKLQQAFHSDNAYLALYDSMTSRISIPYMLDAGEVKSIDPFPMGEGLTSLVIQSRQPLLINRDAEKRMVELGARSTGVPARSFLAVPVLAGETVLGVISVQDLQKEDAFDEAQIRLLTAIAANVGVALQNARLFEEVQRRAEQQATAAEVSQATISMLNPDELIVQSVELIRDRFSRSAGVYYAALFLVDETGRWARLRHATGEAGRVLLERGHKLEVGPTSMVGWATSKRRARVALDVGVEPVRFANPLLPQTRSEIALPLIVGEHVLGALDVQSTLSGAFAPVDVAVLQTMADQLAVAIQNARLFDQTARQARRERLVVDITSKIRAAGDVDTMLRTAVSELRQALGVSHGAVRLSLPGATPRTGTGTLDVIGGGSLSSKGTGSLAPGLSGPPPNGNGNGSRGGNGSHAGQGEG